MEQQIRDVLEELRGALQADGGDMEVVAIHGTKVRVWSKNGKH